MPRRFENQVELNDLACRSLLDGRPSHISCSRGGFTVDDFSVTFHVVIHRAVVLVDLHPYVLVFHSISFHTIHTLYERVRRHELAYHQLNRTILGESCCEWFTSHMIEVLSGEHVVDARPDGLCHLPASFMVDATRFELVASSVSETWTGAASFGCRDGSTCYIFSKP